MGIVNYGFDRSDFLLTVMGQFNNKPNKEAVERIYNQLMEALNKQSTPYNQVIITEKRRILMETYGKFKNDEFRKKSKGFSPRKISTDFEEEILGTQKRHYDMSHKYDKGMIATKTLADGTQKEMVGLKPLDELCSIFYDEYGREFIIQPTGRLMYQSGVSDFDYMTEYTIEIPISNTRKKEFKGIFTNIDLNLLTEDKKYAEAVFGELLSKNTLEHTNAGGYIGQIVPSRSIPQHQENDDEESGFYTYQVNDTHALSVDLVAATAAKIWKDRQKAKNKDMNEGR